MTNVPTAMPAPSGRARLLAIGSIVLALVAITTLLVSMHLRKDRANIGRTHDRLADLVTPSDQVLERATTNDERVLNDVHWVPGGARESRAVVCVETTLEADALIDALSSLELVWVAGGREQARLPVEDAARAPRYGLDRRCMEFETVDLEIAEPTAASEPAAPRDEAALPDAAAPGAPPPPVTTSDREGYRVLLVGELDVVALEELGEARVTSMVVDSRAMTWYERGAVVLLLLGVVMRLLLWQATSPVRLVQRVWSPFDPVLIVGGAIVLTVIVGTVLGISYDAGLMSFSTAESIDGIRQGTHVLGPSDMDSFVGLLLANTAVFSGVAWGAARLRTRETATALRTVHSARFGVLKPLLGGLVLAVLASVLMTNFQPDQTSHMQWVTSMPGTLLATAAFACLSPWFEELFFRGAVFSSIESAAGRHVAAVLAVVLFVLPHVPQHVGFLLPLVPILVVAVACTWVRYASGSATPSFALHLGYNALLVLPALFL